MNVLSLFDGMSCGQLALQKAGIHYDTYYASEIDKYAIKVSSENFPNMVHLGDVTQLKAENLSKIDLLIGGSPCQGFSFAGKQLNFNDSRSALFFEYVRLLKELKPKYFLLENVVMKKEFQAVITEHLGVEPIMINSSLVSAQNRKRLYWTNIPNVDQPKDKGIILKDILETNKDWNKATILGRRLLNGVRKDNDKSIPLVQCLEVRATKREKSNCLTTVAKDTVLTPLGIGRHADVYGKNLEYRDYTLKECCRLQTVPDNYLDVVSINQAKKMLGNGWTVDVIAHIFKGILI